ncbi:MAG TPA: protein kinase [Terriglobales bacterium]|jgi:tetratricopeptide (TPR) repeat protein/predicted Ser/Thr protein kinase|nr:protein kinase [Terriglobales bacterium]
MPAKPAFVEVLGHYRILERAGQGGMGVVYRAQDEHLQREVALKVLPDNVTHDESARRRFRQEALTLARLNHSNIETLYSFESDGDKDFLVMEYIRGVTLASKLAAGPLSEPELVEYATQLASALETAHKEGVIHRDLKPSNILITPGGQLKMLDFGLARLLTSDWQSTTASDQPGISGTLPYVAPEDLSGSHNVDARSDLYSCGVIMYEMATALRPYTGDSVAALLRAILQSEPAPLRSVNPAISPELDAIIRKAMDKNPGLRYQSARELKVDLQRLVSARKIDHAMLPAPRSRRKSWLTVVLLLALALGVGVMLRRSYRSLHPPANPPRVVAVLPFEAVGGAGDNQILCRGLTDLLTTRLTQISKQYGVEVVPASEVRTQGINSITSARQKLGVTLVVEGSWDFVGNQVMYSLVDAQSRHNMSAEFVKANMDDLLSVEHNVADNLLNMVAGELRPTNQNAKLINSSSHPDAYQYYVRGVGYLQDYQDVGSLNSAIALFHSALDRDPSFAPALAGTGEAYWRLFQETKDESLIPKAVEACHRAAQLNNNLASVHITLGLIAQGQSKDDEAVKDFQRAIALDDTSDAAYRGLAISYEALGKTADAESVYRRAIEMRKDYWGGYSALGAFYYKNARYEDAATQFRRVIDLAPENVRGYTNLGGIYVLQGKPQQAEEVLRKSLSIEPNYRAYTNLGALFFAQGRYSDSTDMFEKATQLNNRDPRVWRNLGDAYYWTPEQRSKAGPAYKRAAELLISQRKISPHDPNLMSELALCDSMLGKQQEALALIASAAAQTPSDPEIQFRAAEIYEQGGDHAAALKKLALAVRMGYSVADIRGDPTLGQLHKDPRYQNLVEDKTPKSPDK